MADVKERRGTALKRAAPAPAAKKEEKTRQENAKRLAVLGAEDDSVKLLEELVFGAEEELLERLVEVRDVIKHRLFQITFVWTHRGETQPHVRLRT